MGSPGYVESLPPRLRPLRFPRGARTRVLLVALASVGALVVGVGVAHHPLPAVLAAAALALFIAVAVHPPIAAYTLLATTPLVIGVSRGQALPVLRPSEVIALVVGAGFVARVLLTWLAGRRPDVGIAGTPIGATMVLLVLTGSVLPLLWMVVRARPITHDDFLYALVMWKFYGIFLIFRFTVRTEPQVRRCLWITLAASTVVAILGVLQARGLFGVEGFIKSNFTPDLETGALSNGATSTLGSNAALGDVMTFSLAIAGSLLVRGSRHRVVLATMGALFVAAVAASGEFASVLGLVVGVVAFGFVTRTLVRTLLAFAPAALFAGVLLAGTIQRRLNGFDNSIGLPSSWVGRIDNLRTFFWPPLRQDYNWLTGVRISPRIPVPDRHFGFVWIESGHTWLLWTGGVAFLLAFFVYLAVAATTMAKVARRRFDAVGVAGIAGFSAVCSVGVLMTIDVHLTLRGSADLCFALLALALTGHRARGRPRGEP